MADEPSTSSCSVDNEPAPIDNQEAGNDSNDVTASLSADGEARLDAQSADFNPFKSSALFSYPIIKDKETGTLSAVCPVCLLRVQSLKNLDSHIRRHFEQHVCASCSKTFRSKKDLRQHVERHNGVQVICPECGLGFSSKAVYRSHRHRKHTGAKRAGEQRVSCPLCSKQLRLDSMPQHLLTQHHLQSDRRRAEALETLKNTTNQV